MTESVKKKNYMGQCERLLKNELLKAHTKKAKLRTINKLRDYGVHGQKEKWVEITMLNFVSP